MVVRMRSLPGQETHSAQTGSLEDLIDREDVGTHKSMPGCESQLRLASHMKS